MSAGWHHVAAVKSTDRLMLFVNGELVSQTSPFDATSHLVDANQPLRLGTGTNGPLNGTLADVRIDRRAIDVAEIRELAKLKPKD